MTIPRFDLAVIGAGLAGSGLLASLRLKRWVGTAILIEAGRGPGGRASSRRKRDDPCWRLDHGAPVLHLSVQGDSEIAALVQHLQVSGAIEPLVAGVVSLGPQGLEPLVKEGFGAEGTRWRGRSCLASVADALLAMAAPQVTCRYGVRIQHLHRDAAGWTLFDGVGHPVAITDALVLSGNLLAHPRSLQVLGMRTCPLRDAVQPGVDPSFDLALGQIAELQAEPRWTRMLSFPAESVAGQALPTLIECTPPAVQRWGVERLLLHPQADGRLGVVAHGFNPEVALSAEMIAPWSSLADTLAAAEDCGVMRWGAARPLAGALPPELQCLPAVRLGFCGDWIGGEGFGFAQGALRSAVELASQLLGHGVLRQGSISP